MEIRETGLGQAKWTGGNLSSI